MMTKLELIAKRKLLDILNKQGYPTYSKLLDKFHVNLTSDPEVIAYMEPGKGRIVLNRGLKLEQVSVIVRHEILHEYLSHAIRAERHVGKDKWDKRSARDHDRFNRAADYEISNRGYTDADKITARSIKLNDQVLQGLVTDIDHPEWVDLSMEEMYDLLEEEMEQLEDEASQSLISIGNKGSAATQEAEDLQRQADAVIDDADEIIENPSSSKEEKDQAKEDKQKAQQAKDKAEEAKDEAAEATAAGSSSSDKSNEEGEEGSPTKEGQSIFDSQAEKDRKLEKAKKRIEEAEALLKDLELGQKIQDETEDAIEREKQIKAAEDAKKFKTNPLSQFVDSLNRFIRKAVGVGRGRSYGKINKTYANTSIIRPGKSRRVETHVPSINVYFDQSASWNESMLEIGRRGIATLNQYVRQGKLKINVYYFSDWVSGNREEVAGHATGAIKYIFKHIKDSKADNVIIMTDGDMDSQGGSVSPLQVPGAVWFLFVNDECDKLKDNLSGRQLTKSIFIKS